MQNILMQDFMKLMRIERIRLIIKGVKIDVACGDM